MPLYEYLCDKCGSKFELIEKFSDVAKTVHEGCGGSVHRLISAPALQFKGTGFYITDYAKSGSGGKGDSKKSSEGGDSSDSKSKSSDTSSTPAPSTTPSSPSSAPSPSPSSPASSSSNSSNSSSGGSKS